jgi:hypothetical protein
MKIEFNDQSFIECIKENDKVTIIVQAKDYTNPLKRITNTVELTREEFKKLISDI